MIKLMCIIQILFGANIIYRILDGIFGSFYEHPAPIGIGLLYGMGLMIASFLTIRLNKWGRMFFVFLVLLSLVCTLLGLIIMGMKLPFRSFLLTIYPFITYRFMVDPFIPINTNLVYWIQVFISIGIPTFTIFYFSHFNVRQKFK